MIRLRISRSLGIYSGGYAAVIIPLSHKFPGIRQHCQTGERFRSEG